MPRCARPIRLRGIDEHVGFWRIVTLSTFTQLSTALDRARRRANCPRLIWIEHADARATLDHVNPSTTGRYR